MASALMNMMVDEEKKKAGSTNSAPAQPSVPQPPAPMPPAPSPGTPAQVENAGAGAPPQAAGPAAPDPLALLGLGQGPLNPATTQPPAAPARGRQMAPRAGRVMPPRATPEPVPQTPTYVDPSFGTTESIFDQPLTDAPEIRKDPTTAKQRGVENPFANTPASPREMRRAGSESMITSALDAGDITPEAATRGRNLLDVRNNPYGLSQGVVTTGQGTEANPVVPILKGFDATAPIYQNQNDNQINRTQLIAQQVISAATSRMSGINPLTPLKRTLQAINQDVDVLKAKRASIVNGDVSAILDVLPVFGDDPVVKAITSTPGVTMQDVRSRYVMATGTDLPGLDTGTLNDYSKDAIASIDQQIKDITDSNGYKALQNAVSLTQNTDSNTARERIAKGTLAYMLAAKEPDGSPLATRAQMYAENERNMPFTGVAKTGLETDFEDLLASMPGFDKYFKRGEAGSVAQLGAKLTKRADIAGALVKTSIGSLMRDYSGGTRLAPAKKATGDLINALIAPLMSQGQLNQFDPTTPPWARSMISGIADIVPIADPKLEQLIDLPDGEAKTRLLRTVAGSYGGKGYMESLFDFDIKGVEDSWLLDSKEATRLLNNGDVQGAAKILSPYSTNDQLINLFGEENTTDVGIYGEKSGVLKNPFLSPITDMTGFSGARNQRIRAYRSRQEALGRGYRRTQSMQTGSESGRSVIAGMGALLGVPPNLMGLPNTEDVRDSYRNFTGAPGEMATTQMGLFNEDLVRFITPGVDEKMMYAPDPVWDKAVRDLDVSIVALQNNIENGTVGDERVEAARDMLAYLKNARNSAQAEMEAGIEVGTSRGFLFRMNNDQIDYSQPLKANSGTARSAQAIDMIGAWVANKPGVDINDYFKAQQRGGIKSTGRKIVGFAEDVDGNPIESKPVYGDGKSVARIPVFERIDNQWVQKVDVAGRKIFKTKAQQVGVMSVASALTSAGNDETSVGVDRKYVALQMRGLTSDVAGILRDATDSRVDDFIDVTGIVPDENGRIVYDDMQRFLTTMDKFQGKRFLGWLNAYTKSAALAPDSRVGWAMNATSDRGRAVGVDDRAISNIEREGTRQEQGFMQKQMDTTWQSLTATARNIANSFEAQSGGIDAEATNIASKNRVISETLKNHKYVDESTPEGRLLLTNLDKWVDAYIADDDEARVRIHQQTANDIRYFAKTEAPVRAEENIRANIRKGNAATVTPAEKSAREAEARQRRINADKQSKASEEAARRRARNKAVYYKHDGKWVELRNPDGTLLSGNVAKIVSKQIDEGSLPPVMVDRLTQRAVPVTSISILKSLDPNYTPPKNMRKGQLRVPNVTIKNRTPASSTPAPSTPAPTGGKPKGGGTRAMGFLMGAYGAAQAFKNRGK